MPCFMPAVELPLALLGRPEEFIKGTVEERFILLDLARTLSPIISCCCRRRRCTAAAAISFSGHIAWGSPRDTLETINVCPPRKTGIPPSRPSILVFRRNYMRSKLCIIFTVHIRRIGIPSSVSGSLLLLRCPAFLTAGHACQGTRELFCHSTQKAFHRARLKQIKILCRCKNLTNFQLQSRYLCVKKHYSPTAQRKFI